MKKIELSPVKGMLFLAMFTLCSVLTSVKVFAQTVPDKVDVNINSNTGNAWYAQPWMWAIGVAVFIVLIVAITRSNKST